VLPLWLEPQSLQPEPPLQGQMLRPQGQSLLPLVLLQAVCRQTYQGLHKEG
jgi:hypothetical protein